MSSTSGHPFFVARLPTGEGCGHQHHHQQGARNCGLALLERAVRHRQPLTSINVCEVSRSDGGRDHEKTVERLYLEKRDAPPRLRV